MAEHGFKFVEDGLADADGAVADHACHGAADAVSGVTELLDYLGHPGGDFGGRTADRGVGVDFFSGNGGDK